MKHDNKLYHLTITVLFTLFTIQAIYDAALYKNYLSLVQLYCLAIGLLIFCLNTHRLVDKHICAVSRTLSYFIAPWILYSDIRSHNKLVDTAMIYSSNIGEDAQIERAMLKLNRPEILRKEIKDREASFHAN
ncbi:hypothetical protein ACP3V3_01830 [Vibrio sp. PNB22_3_1]